MYIIQKIEDQGRARNTGIENAKGQYIYFPDADDQLEENAISMLVAGMQKGKYDLVVFGYKSLDKNGNTVLLKQYPEMEKKGEDVRQDYSNYVASTRSTEFKEHHGINFLICL